MEFGPATYGDAFADVYDTWYGSPPPPTALDRLADLVEGAGGPLLELGAGTGRLALPLAARGIGVVALDASDAMLEQLVAKQHHDDRCAPLLADMACIPLRDGTCGVVLCATNNLLGLGDRETQVACLTEAARVLTEHGVLVVEAAVPASPPRTVERRIQPTRPPTRDAVVLTVTERHPGTNAVRGAHVEVTDAGLRLRPWRLALVDPVELDEIAGQSGLTRLERWADWSGTPFDETTDGVAVTVYGRSP